VFTSLLGLVIVSHLSPRGLGRFNSPRHVDEFHVLPFYYNILLWCVGSGELMLDALLLKILFHLKILELRSIVAPDFLHLELKLILGSP
jgi:hypothetical protein